MKPIEGLRETYPWSREILATVAILSLLVALSFYNSYFFPITQTDGIWYHIKAMVYFREGDGRSDFNNLQHRFYSPFVPLLFTWLISLDWKKLKIISPAFYACLLIIFYFRLRESSGNAKLSAVFTLLLGTTPYFWWHSVQSVLNLAAGVYYSLGVLFWYFLIMQTKEGVIRPSLFLCADKRVVFWYLILGATGVHPVYGDSIAIAGVLSGSK